MSSRPAEALPRSEPAPRVLPPRSGADWGEHGTWIWRGLAVHWRQLDPPEGAIQRPGAGLGAVLLLHGFGAASGHWRHNAEALAAEGWAVYALDLIGFGASEQPGAGRLPGGRLDNRLWARQVQAFLQEVVGAPAVLVGHSLGALVATTCATFFPLWVRGVVAATLPDPALMGRRRPRPPRRRPRRRLKRQAVVLLCRLLPLELLVPLLAHSPLLAMGIQLSYAVPVIGDRELRRLIALPARRPGAVRSLRSMSIAMALRPHGATAPSLVPRLRRPLLLFWGTGDQLVPLQVGEALVRLRPDLPLHTLEGCGHCLHDEAPQPFHDAVIPWLQQLAPAQATAGP